MGLMSQSHIPYCCFIYITEKKSYLSKIIKCDEELILKNMGSLELFENKFEKGELLEKDIFLYERSQNGDEVYIWECKPKTKLKFVKYNFELNPIDIFFGIGEGRIYIEEGRFNTKDEGKRKLLDNDGYLIDNPNYRFKEFEKSNKLFRYCKLG